MASSGQRPNENEVWGRSPDVPSAGIKPGLAEVVPDVDGVMGRTGTSETDAL